MDAKANLSTYAKWLETLQDHFLPVILILIGIFAAFKFIKILGRKIIEFTEDDDRSTVSEREKRAQTLVNIMTNTMDIAVIIIAILMIFHEIGINVTPLLAGAGIVGVAIGFGAQSLVKDVLNGFFILMENQFRVGDVIKAAGLAGLVERINLRTTVLRDQEGAVHIIPNGQITTVSNLTFSWSCCVLDFGISYKEDVNRVICVLEAEGEQMRLDPKYEKVILEKPTVLGIENFADSHITLRMVIKTMPLKQWEVARGFRLRAKLAFDREGIEIPFPQQVVWQGGEWPNSKKDNS